MLAALGTTVAGWLASQGAGLLLGFVAQLFKDYVDGARSAQAQRDAGAASTAAKINQETADAERRAAAVKPLDRDNAASRLDPVLSNCSRIETLLTEPIVVTVARCPPLETTGGHAEEGGRGASRAPSRLYVATLVADYGTTRAKCRAYEKKSTAE
jgi:hypothetical protein